MNSPAVRPELLLDTDSTVQEALVTIRRYRDIKGLNKLLALLESASEGADQSTIFRWLRTEGAAPRHWDARQRILRAARVIDFAGARANIISFVVIPGASELLPVLFLDEIPDLSSHVSLIEKKSVDECFAALAANEVDVAIAPRRSGDRYPSMDFNPSLDALSCIKRVCRLVTVQPDGLFPGSHQSAEFLARALHNQHRRPHFQIGCLRNARYDLLLNKLMVDYDERIRTCPISDSGEAIQKICAGEIKGVVGHNIFVTNVLKGIERIKNSNSSGRKARKILQELNLCRVPRDAFHYSPIKMDVFVNLAYTNGFRVRKALGLLWEANKHINANRENPSFWVKVSKKLKLGNSSEGGRNVLNEFMFEMETFETEVLLRLWGGGGVEQGSLISVGG